MARNEAWQPTKVLSPVHLSPGGETHAREQLGGGDAMLVSLLDTTNAHDSQDDTC